MKSLLKFRAWHKELKQMFPVNGFVNLLDKTMIYANELPLKLNSNILNFDEAKLWKPDEIELMQWTGWQASGIDLYEGDIITIDFGGGVDTYLIEYAAEDYRCLMARLMYSDTVDHYDLYDIPVENAVIVGNRWQNPELLGGTNEQ